MARFALIVTLVELALTAAAALWITAEEAGGTFLTERDLETLGIPYSALAASTRRQGEALTQDARATLSNPVQSLYVSLRPETSLTDYEFRKGREEALTRRPDRGQVSLSTEPWGEELGYAVRHQSDKSMRFELTRHRSGDLLIVRVVREAPYPAGAAQEMALCERRARQVQEHLLVRLGWRD